VNYKILILNKNEPLKFIFSVEKIFYKSLNGMCYIKRIFGVSWRNVN